MIMDLNTFRTKINAGRIICMGRFSCRMIGSDYYFFGETTEVFESFEKLWDRVSGYILYGVNYFGENTE